jgi:hypothetical protein
VQQGFIPAMKVAWITGWAIAGVVSSRLDPHQLHVNAAVPVNMLPSVEVAVTVTGLASAAVHVAVVELP